MSVTQAIRDWLTKEGAAFREVHHEPTLTSADSARARGEDLRIGGKALLFRGDAAWLLCVLPADMRADSAAIRKELKIKSLRFATPEELLAETGLVPGSVPPFGPPILPFPLYVDSGIARNERIAFNAGSLTDSVIMATADYLRLSNPRLFAFAKTAATG